MLCHIKSYYANLHYLMYCIMLYHIISYYVSIMLSYNYFILFYYIILLRTLIERVVLGLLLQVWCRSGLLQKSPCCQRQVALRSACADFARTLREKKAWFCRGFFTAKIEPLGGARGISRFLCCLAWACAKLAPKTISLARNWRHAMFCNTWSLRMVIPIQTLTHQRSNSRT